MAASDVSALHAASQGRAAKGTHEAEGGEAYDPEFTPGDLARFDGEWAWFIGVVRAAAGSGPAPAIDDDLAYVRPWGFDPATIKVPTLQLQGDVDKIAPSAHASQLAQAIPAPNWGLVPDAISPRGASQPRWRITCGQDHDCPSSAPRVSGGRWATGAP